MKKTILFLLVSLVSVLSSCHKNGTTLQLQLKDAAGNPVSGASVQIFTSETDWEKKTNPVQSGKVSDGSGKVSFTNLSTLSYFVYAEKDCINNTFEGVQTTMLPENKTSVFAINLTSTANIKFVNKTNNKHRIGINGLAMLDVAGNSEENLVLKTGTYTVRVLQIENIFSTPNPTDKTSYVTLDCGQVNTIEIL